MCTCIKYNHMCIIQKEYRLSQFFSWSILRVLWVREFFTGVKKKILEDAMISGNRVLPENSVQNIQTKLWFLHSFNQSNKYTPSKPYDETCSCPSCGRCVEAKPMMKLWILRMLFPSSTFLMWRKRKNICEGRKQKTNSGKNARANISLFHCRKLMLYASNMDRCLGLNLYLCWRPTGSNNLTKAPRGPPRATGQSHAQRPLKGTK